MSLHHDEPEIADERIAVLEDELDRTRDNLDATKRDLRGCLALMVALWQQGTNRPETELRSVVPVIKDRIASLDSLVTEAALKAMGYQE